MPTRTHIDGFTKAGHHTHASGFTALYIQTETPGSEVTIHFHGERHEQRARIAAAALNGIDPELLADLIEEGIDDVHDMGVTFSDYAKAAAENVLKHLGEPA